MPAKTKIDQPFREELDRLIAKGEGDHWKIQLCVDGELSSKPLGECLRADLRNARDIVLNSYTWSNFEELQNRLINEFVASNSERTFGEYRRSTERSHISPHGVAR